MKWENRGSENEFQKVANRVSIVTILWNSVLSIGKLIAGIVAHSNAMISDAVHSASDVFSTIVVIIGIQLASKASDKEHPYGHERLECVAAMLLAMVLFITGFEIGLGALKTICSFVTNGGGGCGRSTEDIRNSAKGATVIESVDGNQLTEEQIENW